jgi:hypothetical protein
MQTPTLTPEQQQLHRFVGTWAGEEHIQPSPWDPAGATALGRVRNVAALDGTVVIQDYEQERGGQVVFRGHGVFRWDPAAGEHVLHWFDTMSPQPREFRGGFADGVFTAVSREERGQARGTWDFSRPDAYAYRLEASPDGAAWSLYIEGTYRREG